MADEPRREQNQSVVHGARNLKMTDAEQIAAFVEKHGIKRLTERERGPRQRPIHFRARRNANP